jgi:alpha-tubulin suppressor-like RCC1 family protein
LGDKIVRNVFTQVTSFGSVTAIATGSHHSLALTNDGKVYATGDNLFGQLGLGDKIDRNVFIQV